MEIRGFTDILNVIINRVLSNIIPKLRALGEACIGVDTIWKQELVGLGLEIF